MTLENIFEKLWNDYIKQNPDVKKVYELFLKKGEKVENDHIAFRTYNHPKINIDALSKTFIQLGYKQKGEYNFEQKKLFAKHFELEGSPNSPRIFISELKLEEMSRFLNDTVTDVISQIKQEDLADPYMFMNGRLWNIPDYNIYEKLRNESEYAAWLYVYGFRANHFTVSINSLTKFITIDEVNQFLIDNGFKMNESGGMVKGNPNELLEQSSIVAGTLPVEFTQGIKEIPSCYYEFARRYPDKDGKLYNGFIAKSADKIFESTDFYTKNDD